jgi:gliding motility-associated-like protein
MRNFIPTLILMLALITAPLLSYAQQCSANAGQNQTICLGQSVTLGGNPTAVNSNPGVAYDWDNNIADIANPVVTPNQTTTYEVELDGGGNCDGQTDQITITVINPPNANFSISPQNQCATTPVSFTNTTTGCNNCTYSWNFGDPASGSNNTSTATNPTHVFQAFGNGTQTFAVTLTVTGPGPNFCQDTQTTNVTVNQVPDPVLIDPITDFAQCSGDAVFNVTVFDGSTPAAAASYTINWGDGTTNWTGTTSPQGVTHPYTTVDVFDLVYTVTGTNGCSNSETIFVSNITNPAVGAGIDGGTQGCGPFQACFNILNWQSNHESTTYTVDYGDGSPTVSLNHPPPSQLCHTYTGSSCASGGAYTFTITATNNCDNSVATITPVRVYTAPQASFVATPVPACVNSAVSFLNNSVLGYNNSCSQTALFTWSWGDATPNTVVANNSTQSHAYTAPGNYTVTLSAQNSCGTTTYTQVICVETPPTPIFSVNTNTGCLPLTVNTTNTSDNGIPCNVNYTWLVDYVDLPCDPDNGSYSFGGGTSGSSLSPQFILNSVGTYTLRLRMTNACGIFEDTEVVTVNTVPVVVVNPITTICSGNSVTPSALVDNCNLPITSYAWSFPSGTPTSASTLSPGAVSYATPGNYTATLTATNACGPSSASAPITVLTPPVVNIVSNTTDNHVCINSNITLSASGAASYSWSPGGQSGSSITVSPTTTTTYTVTGNSGTCTDQETITIILDPLPVVSASGTFSMCIGETEQLGLNVTGGLAPYTSYLWNNGATLSSTTIANPISNATVTTNYNVQVTDSNGCVGTANVPVTVNPLPVVNAGPDTQLCNQPVATNLTGFSPTTGGTGVWSGTGVTSAGVFTPTAVGCVNLTYTFTNSTTGCTNSDVVQICVIDPVQANGGPDFNVCNSTTPYPLPAGGTWTGPGVTSNSFLPSTVGTFTLTYTVGSGSCLTSDQVVVTVLSPPTVNAGADITICASSTINLNATASSTNGAISTISWSSACGGITNGNTLTPTITPVGANCTYNITVVDAASCSAQDQLNVTINPLPVVNAGPDFTLCNQPIATTLTGFSPAGGVWTTTPGITLAGNTITPAGNGVFTLTYTYTNPATNCVNSDQLVVTVNSPVNANAGPDIELCHLGPNFTIVAPVTGGTWGPVPTVTTGGVFNPNTVGSYTLTYTTGSGTCLTSDQMVVTVNGLPTIDVGNNASICLNDSIQINGVITGGQAPFNVSWNFPATLSNATIASPIAFPAVTTNYTVTVTDNNQCVDTDNIIISVNGLPTVNAGNNLTLCNQPIVEVLTGFSPTTGGTGTWSGPGITNPNGQFTSPGVGTYWVYYEFTAGGNACSNIDSIQITVNPPVIANAGPNQTFCLNDAQTVFAGINPPTGGTWSGTGITNTSTGLFNPQAAGVGTYTLTLQNGQGTCFTQDQMQVTVLGLPTVIAGPNQTLCGNALPFNMAGYTPATGGTWEGTGITNATLGSFNPSIGAGSYNIFLWYEDPLTGCSDTSYKTVTISPVPNANFTVAPLGCTNAQVDLTNSTTGATGYEWTMGNGDIVTGIDPFYIYPDEGIFTIQLVASNGFGCRDTLLQNNEIIDPPSASFNLLPAEGCAPLNVSFENLSVGQYVTYDWDLSLIISTDQIPQAIIYPQGDDVVEYPVSLTVSNFCGTSTDNDIVTVNPQPIAGFGTNMDVFCSPFTVVFNNTSTGNPDTFEWDFGDGTPNIFVEEPINHVFFADTIPVDYTIHLYLSNECGVDTTEYTITVLPNTVTAFFNTNITEGCSPLSVEFTDFSEGGNQLQYNFGDGNFTGIANPTHIFNDPGFYTIYQYVDNGCSYDTTEITIEVFPSPTIDFIADDPTVCANEGIQFTPEIVDVVSISWDFGDGGTSNISSPIHVFPNAGQFNVTATAVSDNLCTASVTNPVTVYAPPVAGFTIPDQVGCSPFNACFTNSSAGGLFYEWDFGDGNTANTPSACNEYTNFTAAPQLYTVRLIAQNLQLCTDTLEIDIVVSPQPVASFALSSIESCSFPVNVQTSNSSSYANGYSWIVDGDVISDLTNTNFDVASVGGHSVQLVASNQYGCSSIATSSFTVHPLPQLQIDAFPYEGCEDLDVQFANLTTGAVDYIWDFGDGNQSNDPIPSHTYTDPGIYVVTLIATSDQGCTEFIELGDFISVYDIPQAYFIPDPRETTIYEPTIQFLNLSTGATEYLWNFGDGRGSDVQYPLYTYEEGGVYDITLTVTSGAGCSSTHVDRVVIQDIFNIYVPNIFTPDDDGINEVFLPIMTGKSFIERYKFQIFDRWGTVIFETNDTELPWVGEVRGGDHFAKDEAYNWQVTVQLKGVDKERIYSGHVILMR